MPKSSSEESFAKLFNLANDEAAPSHEREAAERKLTAWLKRHGKTKRDIQAILVRAAQNEAARNPPPPPSDPRDAAPNPYDDPRFSPAGLVEGIVSKYVTMSSLASVIYALMICLTHVYTWFGIAPRVWLVSEEPHSGKSIARRVARHLVFRPNQESLGTGAAIRDFLEEGPGTIMLDELDLVDPEGRRRLQLIWNLGHERGASISLMVGGKRKVVDIFAPIFAAGIGSLLTPTQKSRTFTLQLERYTEETKPERDYNIEVGIEGRTEDFDAVYTFLRHWAERVRAGEVKLNPRPLMPAGMIHRFADNVRGLLSIADSCGPEWGRRAREALTFYLEKEKAERPEIVMIRHGLVIFDTGSDELGQIDTHDFNREIKRLDLPDAMWMRYRGASGTDYARPIEMREQGRLLAKVGIRSVTCWPPGKRQPGTSFRGYKRAQFEEAWRKYGAEPPDGTEPGRPRPRLVAPSPE
jgi:Protein of unknown function (DUF3631)